MSAEAPAKRTWTPAEYLAWERASPERHEFHDGEIFAMAGASFAHNKIVGNMVRELGNALRNRPCDVVPSDLRVKIPVPGAGLYTYPDALVVCGEAHFEDDARDTLLNPTVILEVLSESTEAYDRGKKFRYYRAIPSLREYVLVAQDVPSVERHVCGEGGVWSLVQDLGAGGTLVLPSIGCEIAVDELYWKVFAEVAAAT